MRSALVTGGSSGIGFALAQMLRDEGYELTLVARQREKLAAAAEQLGVEGVAADVSREDECVRAVAAHADRWNGLDVLVNCAGIGIGGSFGGLSTKKIDLQIDVNLRGTMIVTREALPLLRESRGSIVTLASIAGTLPVPGLSVYAATKAALISWTASLNREEAEHGIRATALCPGFVATPMTDWTGIPPEEMIQTSDVVELARAVLRLSPRARVPEIVVERVGDAI